MKNVKPGYQVIYPTKQPNERTPNKAPTPPLPRTNYLQIRDAIKPIIERLGAAYITERSAGRRLAIQEDIEFWQDRLAYIEARIQTVKR